MHGTHSHPKQIFFLMINKNKRRNQSCAQNVKKQMFYKSNFFLASLISSSALSLPASYTCPAYFPVFSNAS
jgi:hypothetical protein